MSESMDIPPSGHSGYSSRGKQNYAVRRPRGSRGRSSRGKTTDRTATWRNNQNQKVVAEEDAARNARFARIGLGPDPNAPSPTQPSTTPEFHSVQFLGMAITSYARPVPISTQGIGFIVNQYYLKLQEQLGVSKVAEKCSVHQLYRYSLAQLSYHLYRLRLEQVPRYSYRSAYPNPPTIPADFHECLKTFELNVGFITSYIQRIGCVIANDVPHVPMLMWDFNPLYVNIFNLRRTLEAVSGDDDKFNDFMARNSVPGLATVQGRITNLEEVMPRSYTPSVAYRDASAVRALMNFTAAKMRDVNLYTGRLGQLVAGSSAMLLASTSVPDASTEIRIPTTPLGTVEAVVGSVDNFWSEHHLTDENARLGVIGLYVREDAGYLLPTGNRWLNSEVANYQVSADYAAYLHRLIG